MRKKDLNAKFAFCREYLHEVNIFFDKSGDIGLDPGFFEGFWSEPFIADKSFFFAGPGFCFASIFDEKE